MKDQNRRMLIRTILLGVLMVIATTLPAQTEAPAYKGKVERSQVYGKSLEGNLWGDSPDRDV